MLKVVVTCEHGGNRIPEKYRPVFIPYQELLQTHRGYDIGSLPLFRCLAGEEADDSFLAEESRLLVDLNRSLHHPGLFSEITLALPSDQQKELLRQYYHPYRSAVEARIFGYIGEGCMVFHLSVHTFTPFLQGEERQADIGLLFDPARPLEAKLCAQWQARLLHVSPGLVVRMNYPYLGIDDGLTTHLRTKFGPVQYAGVELEVNQKFFLMQENDQQVTVLAALATSLKNALLNYRK